ncbi:PREDICTED: proline and serine-rich protein 2 [Mandrillus leucophaeus]|uniref:proline and serine-rich protein 2 n=1 Tax=Mandrillus leucophaeus TaxID=9568 RepID=UPI0005F40424|nr:PREDICTED: proline and serine-rich protein 2 [Mandrillus leucophaeus]
MPVTHQKSDASDMNSDTSPNCRLRAFSRGGSLESRSSSSRSRSFTLDDESLKYLTHEEKDVLLFFEETIDSLDEDFEEPVLCDGGVCCLCSPSLEESTSSPSEPEDVVDLVQPAPGAGEAKGLPEETQAAGPAPAGKEHRKQDAETPPPPDPPAPETLPAPPPVPSTPDPPRRELRAPSPPAEHPRLLRSVPTPLVIAHKISERLAGNEALSPTSPSREGRPEEWRTPAAWGPRSRDPGPGNRKARACSKSFEALLFALPFGARSLPSGRWRGTRGHCVAGAPRMAGHSQDTDDESLKYLTHEEKDVLLFFEETIDSLDEDFEEPVLCDGGVCCLCSPSLEESTSSPSEPEDVIDLVQPAPGAGEAKGLPEETQAAGGAQGGAAEAGAAQGELVRAARAPVHPEERVRESLHAGAVWPETEVTGDPLPSAAHQNLEVPGWGLRAEPAPAAPATGTEDSSLKESGRGFVSLFPRTETPRTLDPWVSVMWVGLNEQGSCVLGLHSLCTRLKDSSHSGPGPFDCGAGAFPPMNCLSIMEPAMPPGHLQFPTGSRTLQVSWSLKSDRLYPFYVTIHLASGILNLGKITSAWEDGFQRAFEAVVVARKARRLLWKVQGPGSNPASGQHCTAQACLRLRLHPGPSTGDSRDQVVFRLTRFQLQLHRDTGRGLGPCPRAALPPPILPSPCSLQNGKATRHPASQTWRPLAFLRKVSANSPQLPLAGPRSSPTTPTAPATVPVPAGATRRGQRPTGRPGPETQHRLSPAVCTEVTQEREAESLNDEVMDVQDS